MELRLARHEWGMVPEVQCPNGMFGRKQRRGIVLQVAANAVGRRVMRSVERFQGFKPRTKKEIGVVDQIRNEMAELKKERDGWEHRRQYAAEMIDWLDAHLYKAGILQTIAEPVTKDNLEDKISAYETVAEWLRDDDRDWRGLNAEWLLGLSAKEVDGLVADGTLKVNGERISEEGIRDLLLLWASDLRNAASVAEAA